MPLFINHELIACNPWQSLEEDQPLPESGHILLSLQQLIENKDALSTAPLTWGLKVNGSEDIQQVITESQPLKLIVIEIPAFTDGRGFSFARMLRRAGFQGEIRATGDVSRDRLTFLKRCGFNAFDIPEDRYSPELHQAFTEISVHYQGAADNAKPVYRQVIEG